VPGPPLPQALQTLLFWTRIDRFMRACARRYGATFRLRVFPWGEVVVVSDPEDIRGVFTGAPGTWRAGESYALLAPLIGRRSVVLLDGEEHLRVRRRMLAPFHGDAVSRHESVIESITLAEVASWPWGTPFALLERMRAITLEVMLRAVIGVEEPERLAPLRSALAGAVDLRPLILLMWAFPVLRRVGPWGAFERRLANTRGLLGEEIERRRHETGVAERADVLSILLSSGELGDEDLLDQLATLLLAGHDTSTTALTWTLERLVRNPQALARAREEPAYLDAVVKETLRLRPVLPAVAREAARPVRVAGHVVAAGTTVMPCIRLVQLSEERFPDPLSFRPERFLEGQGGGYSWIPFGGGARRCLGASFASFHMRVVLRTILANVELAPERAADEAVENRHITLVPGRGGRVVRLGEPPAAGAAAGTGGASPRPTPDR
jgi:cytochrome P450